MIDLIKEALQSPAGSFAFVFAILVLAGWGIYFVTKKVTEINSAHGTIKGATTKIEEHIDEMRKDLSYLKGTIDVIKSAANPMLQSHSPISLTPKGKEASKEIDAEGIIARNWDKIYNNLELNVCDKNSYDIQEYSMQTASVEPESFFEKQDIVKIKEYAYRQGNSLLIYMQLMGIIIRDKYLREKGIELSDIDKHDPNKQESDSSK